MDIATMNSKGQIIIPARLRRRYGLEPEIKILFIERNHEIILQPVNRKYIRSLCGILKSDSSLTKELLKERARDKKREEEKLVKRGAR